MYVKSIPAIMAAMALAACSSEPAPPPVQMVSAAPAAPSNFMVFFDWDRSNITPQAHNTIEQAANMHRARGNAPISIVGHADKSGGNDYNMALSLRRANVVKDTMVREGVNQQAIQVAGRGEEAPLVQTADGVREPQNRRVEISMAGATMATVATFEGSDLDYCKHLSRLYRTNVANSNADSVAGAALAQCEAGAYDRGIPTLMRLLTDARFQFPRHSRWNA
jgi:hypothetical protein